MNRYFNLSILDFEGM